MNMWVLLVFIVIVNAAKDYGYFDARITHVETCQGAKRKDCCINKLDTRNNYITFDMDCKQSMSPTKAKIVAFKNRQTVRLQMDKPCNHLFIKPIILNVFNATETCLIAKNTYRFSLDFAEIAQKYYSGMFLYGNWTFKSMFYNDDCNFICMVTYIAIEPKKEQ